MSVNAVSGTSLRQDLVSALRQARAATTQTIDASGYNTASQDTGSTQDTGSAAQTTNAASTPALSSDLMASLLQLQSDFSQMGLQTGVTSAADSDSTASTAGPTDNSQASTGSAPVHHHHGHHARPPESDAGGDTQTGSSANATDATATTDTSTASAGTSTGTESGDGLQSLFQQMTKAIAAYATGGPVGLAATALASSSKA